MSSTGYGTKGNDYVQAAGALVGCVEVDEDVDGGNKHFSKDEDDDDPFEQLALYVVSQS